MSVTHMEPLALWGKNAHTKPSGPVVHGNIKDYVVYHAPRKMFRSAASTFGDVRRTESDARYEEISLQLFLQMLFLTANLEEGQAPADIYPYVKVWLEWVPSATRKDDAVGYNIHAVSLHKDVKFGNALNKMLWENAATHRESMNRKMNSRKADPLSGLHPYQKWMRLTGVEMYVRTICDRYSGTQEYTSEMDSILNPKISVNSTHNMANPSNVFTIEKALARLPESADPIFMQPQAYGNPSSEAGGHIQFPSTEHLLLLTPSQLHPKVFCAKYLPDHQHWMEMQRAIPTKLLHDDYDPNCETEYDIRTPADIEKARLEGLADRSAFANLAIQSKAKYIQDCLEQEHTDDFGQAYKDFQTWAIHAMETQCLDPDACISEVVSKMLTWRNENTHCEVIKHTITDPTLSVFANRVIGLMEGYEQYYLISTAHRMMFLIHHARYDAFRRDFGLHFNCFQAGDGACSKSFLFLMMEKQSIPGTTEVLTYQTGKADAVDGNRNDITTVCHEAPPGMFRTAKNPNADSTQEAMFKEKLTSQRVTAKVWCQDEGTGRRSARLTKSECVGVWMGATNDPPSEVEEALKTRFFWGNFEQQRRKGRDIDDCMNGERMMSSADKAHRKLLFREAQEEQYRVMLVEKAIWAKVIKDVNTTASNILLPRLKAKLTQNSIINPGPRDWERVKIFSRLMAIVTAIETVCNLPGGQYYGVPFAPFMIPDLEPYLKVTEEMVIFTISLLADQFRSPVEHKILNTVWAMEQGAPKFGMPNSDEPCCDYLKLPKLKHLSKRINSRIPLEKGRTSINNIENFIINMTKHSIFSRGYKERVVPVGSTASTDHFPVEMTTGAPRQFMSCVITHEGVYIHMSHILSHREDSSDCIFHILESETHAFSDEKRMLTACPVDGNWFHVMRVIDRKPGGEMLKYKNVLANTSVSRWITRTNDAAAETRTRPGYSIKEDIDSRVAGLWAGKLGKASYTPREIMAQILDAEDYDRPDIRYPDGLTGVSTHPQKRLFDEEDEVGPKPKRAKHI